MPSRLKLSNNSVGRLSANLSAAATSFSLVPGDGAKFPSLTSGEFFPVTAIRSSDGAIEIMKATARSTDTLTVTRAQESTTALAFLAGDRIELRLTAGTIGDELDERLPEIGTYDLLRAYVGPTTAFYVRGIANVFDGGHGIFRVKSSDTTSADNGATILVDAAGRRWYRDYIGNVNIAWFGIDLSGTTVCKDKILKAHQLGKPVDYPDGTYNLGDLQQVGDVADVAVDFTGLGTITMNTGPGVVFKTNMTSAGVTYAFKLNGNSHSRIGDCRFEGSGYDTMASWKGTIAFWLNGGDWGNVQFGDIYCQDMISGITVTGGSASSRIRGISGRLFMDNTYYGYNGANQGDDVSLDIYHYQGRRALFAYGCIGVKARVFIQNPRSTTGTVCIASYPGFPTRDINVEVTSSDVAVGTTVNHILFENFGPEYGTAGITGCKVRYCIDDPNSGNSLIKIVTYDFSGGSEVSTATAAQFHDNEFSGSAIGAAKGIVCTAQYSTPQRNIALGAASEHLEWTALNRLRWSSLATFTPTWTADGGTLPSLGNGTLSGEYYIENKRCYVNVVLVIGSTTTLGSGAWHFGTPSGLVTKSALFSVVGTGRILKSGVDFRMASVTQGEGAASVQLTAHATATQVGPLTPHLWGVGDILMFSYSFPI